MGSLSDKRAKFHCDLPAGDTACSIAGFCQSVIYLRGVRSKAASIISVDAYNGWVLGALCCY